jgi:hypothetical protein
MFKYNTLVLSLRLWLVTAFISPIVFMISIWIKEWSVDNIEDIITGLLLMWLIGVFYSFPAWLTLFLLMSIIEKLLPASTQMKLAWLISGLATIAATFYFMAGSHEINRLLELLINIVIYYIIVYGAGVFFFMRQIKSIEQAD